MTLLPLAVIGLVLCIGLYVVFRRQRHGGLAGGSAILATPHRAASLGSDRVYSEQEVAQHNTAEDLWLIIKGKVYDLSPYIALHPGGEAMLRNAGRDSTKGFSGSQHPARVWDMIDEFYIGNVATLETSDKKAD
ncbi:Cytochrome B5-like protein [Gracilariopsis chorda]|uniref:Cytochrome B5-like protein n=1 Tax=Gracilariopsis chorda TaxID=448386 RepID=A0A2V3IML4_9FLOR|nr:Cytochrome B5-like protein [Gracilariopsis chorda]|eukprot:PXF43325.1 Cytochrome B5-like protein [Gracilariopsis chorda]